MINYRFAMADAAPNITQILLPWRGGRQDALNQLLPVVYDELRNLARSQLRRRGIEGTLDTGGLVHEAYLRMVDQQRVVWQDRAHFYGLASNLMRSILVDHYRARHAQKRGGDARHVELEDLAEGASLNWREHFLDLDQAMNRLATLDPEQARMVELRFFGGLNIEETAEVMGVSPATVKNRWSMARAWLHRELRGG
jgi:RNA polymerase sigma factor (TIGR02999 family)